MTPEQVAILDANPDVVEVARLFLFELAGTTYRLCDREVQITAGGYTWTPGLAVISASGVEYAGGFQAVPCEYVIGGMSNDPTEDAHTAWAALALAVMQQPDQWFGGRVQQYMLMLSAGAPVGDPISLHRGWLRDVVPVEDAQSAYFKLRVESIFERRNRTPLGEYTDRDQKKRSPGDRGCEEVPSLKNKVDEGWLRG